MAAAKARAVSQRTVNRYLAPKLACCPSISSVISKIETKPIKPRDLEDSFPLPNEKSDSKWWIQLQPDYIHQRSLTSEQVNAFEIRNTHQDGGSINSLSSKGSYEFVEMAERDDLGSFVSNKSRILIENCDYNRAVDTGLEPQKIKCGGNAISLGRSQPDTSKSKILDALCHSQTRAREAEIAAKKAYEEKEHAIKPLFEQASQLFAYRRLIHLLQVENLCYQIKNKKSDQMSSVVRVSASKIRDFDKNLKKVAPAKGRRRQTERGLRRYKHDLGKYAIVLMVGLGIVGAGVLLGWTVGWMLI